MPDTFWFDPDSLRALCEDGPWMRGKALLAQGVVGEPDIEPMDEGWRIQALVQGTQHIPYEVAVTLAVMPDTPHATTFARQAHKAGKTVILHMPMDPATGPFAWHPELPIEELGKRLDAAFNAVPYTAGINNHMGSRMTAQPVAMAWLMGELQRRHKFFVDSRTSAATVAAAEAALAALPRAA